MNTEYSIFNLNKCLHITNHQFRAKINNFYKTKLEDKIRENYHQDLQEPIQQLNSGYWELLKVSKPPSQREFILKKEFYIQERRALVRFWKIRYFGHFRAASTPEFQSKCIIALVNAQKC